MDGNDNRDFLCGDELVFPRNLSGGLNTLGVGGRLTNETGSGEGRENRHAVLLGRHADGAESGQCSGSLGSLLDNVADARFLQKRESISTINISHGVAPFV